MKSLFGYVSGISCGWGFVAALKGNWNIFAACCLVSLICITCLIGMIIEEKK